jgi:hypothetical protein
MLPPLSDTKFTEKRKIYNMTAVRMTPQEYKDLPKRTLETKYEVGKYYKTLDERLDLMGYVFRCNSFMDGIELELVKVIWTPEKLDGDDSQRTVRETRL